MILVYVAGPYRAATGWGIECNIVAARKLGAEVARLGAFPVVPHANTAHYDGLAGDAFWLEGTLELLRRCDAVVLVKGWRDSSGARSEVAEAARLDKMVFETINELAEWIAYRREAEGE